MKLVTFLLCISLRNSYVYAFPVAQTVDWRNFAVDADYEMKKKVDVLHNDDVDQALYEQELLNGPQLDEFHSSNVHYGNPDKYKNLARRFMPAYPYKEKIRHEQRNDHSGDLIPREAPKDVVLKVMKNAKKRRESQKHTDSSKEFSMQQYKMLRSGDYFNGVQVEEVNPKKFLRSNNDNDEQPPKLRKQNRQKSQRITSQLKPGTNLYDLISKISKYFPRLMIIA